MSRHRFVRNLDLDAEMASDSEEEGMTPEEQAQMASAMPMVRAQLKDLKPSVTDDAIYDSLWHYWFDVDKTVGWLRKDWEKKSEPTPSSLQPTPDEQRRRRSAKSPRTQRDDSPQPPISALQRLSLARKEASTRTGSTSNLPSAAGGPRTADSTESSKPMSKLALLAQKRREEAQAKSSLAGSTTGSAVSSPTEAATESPSKPLSKLAQKMALARAAQVDNATNATSKSSTPTDETPSASEDVEMNGKASSFSALFSPASTSSSQPSPFFNLLTNHTTQSNAVASSSTSRLNLPYVKDEDELEKRVRRAFGPDVDSPDDIVLKARGGRTGVNDGAAATTQATKPVPIKEPIPTTKISSTKATVENGDLATTKAKRPNKGKGTLKPDGSLPPKPSAISSPADGQNRKLHAVKTQAPKTKNRSESQSKVTSSTESRDTTRTGGKQTKPPPKSGGDVKAPPKAKPKPKVVQGPP